MVVANEMMERTTTKNITAKDAQAQIAHLRLMMLIRRFEERTYQEYTRKGQKIGGFLHLYSGQEAVAVGVASVFDHGRDALINGYRCHGHSLALGMSPRVAMAELFGKATGCSKGKGGSMHLFDAKNGNHGGHGIVGGHLPLGVGIAFSQWYKKSGGVTFCLFGDGALNQGSFNEALNLGGLMKLPIVFIVENNGVAMGTQVERASAEKDLTKRGDAYGMPTSGVDGNDLEAVIRQVGEAADRARHGDGPSYLVANTYRFRGHSMSDAMKYRTKEEMEKAKQRDPIGLYQVKLRERGLLSQEQIERLEQEVADEISNATAQADADPMPELESRFDDVLAEKYPFEADGDENS